MGGLFVIQWGAALRKDLGMANATIASHTLVVLFVIESDVAVGGWKDDGVGGRGRRGGRGLGGRRRGGDRIGPDLRSAKEPNRSGEEQPGGDNQKNCAHQWGQSPVSVTLRRALS